MKRLIVNLTPTGMVPTKAMSPHVPITPEEIASTVSACAPFGVSMVHLHARDVDGRATYQKKTYGEIITRIRDRHPELILIASTSGRAFPAFEQRAEVLELEGDLKPDMASLTLGSMNFARAASLNDPDMIMRLAERMQERGIKPELEVFDTGMMNFAHYLIRKQLISPPYYFNIILGNLATAQAKLQHLGLLVSELPSGSVWATGGLGKHQLPMNLLGLAIADGVRVGLEDNLHLDEARDTLATNVDLVGRLRAIADILGRPLATPGEARMMLGLPRPRLADEGCGA